MKTIREREQQTESYMRVCIICIWITVFYSVIIQYKYIQIPYGMVIFGSTILVTYYFAHQDEPIRIPNILTPESTWMIGFMVYMLITGVFIAVDRNGHLSQWMTCLEYLFLQIIIASIIKDTGTNTIHLLLLAKAIALAVIFIRNPVYFGGNRFSISKDVNPNGLGMAFATGIWAILFYQQKKKTPLIIVFSLIAAFAYCIIQTGSRKALIAACLTIVLWLVFCFFTGLKQKGIFYKIFAVIILAIVIAVTVNEFISMYSGSVLATRMDSVLDEASEGKRSNLYQIGFEFFKTSPLFGLGFQGFKYYYGMYSHSTLVEIPVSGGIVGSVIYFGVYIISIFKTIRLLNRTKRNPQTVAEHTRIKMIFILWVAMLFYTTCIIHQYLIESYIIFGLIFGETAYIEKKVAVKQETKQNARIKNQYLKVKNTKIRSKYIRT